MIIQNATAGYQSSISYYESVNAWQPLANVFEKLTTESPFYVLLILKIMVLVIGDANARQSFCCISGRY